MREISRPFSFERSEDLLNIFGEKMIMLESLGDQLDSSCNLRRLSARKEALRSWWRQIMFPRDFWLEVFKAMLVKWLWKSEVLSNKSSKFEY